jgi:sensor histidine kinase YesM
MKEFILYVMVLLIAALMFTFIFQWGEDAHFLQTFFISTIFSFSIGFINIAIFESIHSRINNLEIYLRILLSIPVFFIGTFIGLIVGNYICFLFFGFYPFPSQSIVKFGVSFGFFSVILGSGLMFRERSRELKEKAEIARLEASIKTLQAQINPHFFFNSLASIQSLIHENPEKAEEALAAISEIFRYSMRRGQKDFIELREELEFIKQFLFIEKIRLGDRLKIIWDIDEKLLNCLLPPFIIQPIVENAVKYGVEKQKKGRVKVSVKEKNNELYISVSNTGSTKIRIVPDHSLENIKKRIEIVYGKNGSFEINTNGEVEIELYIPMQYNKNKEG